MASKANGIAPPVINDEYEYVAVDRLIPQPRNIRQSDLGAIYESIKANGFFGACVVQRSTSHVLVGNHRLAAAKELGIPSVPVVWVDVDDDRALRIMLADNATGDLATNNDAKLAELLAELAQTPLGLAGSGFDGDDLDRLIADLAGLPAPGDGGDDFNAEPVEGPTRCNLGDLWRIGEHRLLVGDCRDAETVARLFDGAAANVVVTSPPYASQREYDEASGFTPIPAEEYGAWFDAVQANIAAHLAEDGSYFLNIKEHCENGQRHLYVKDLTIAHVRQWGWRFVDEFCWRRKGVPGGWHHRFKNEWEPVFHFSRNEPKCNRYAVAEQSDMCFTANDNSRAKSKAGQSVFNCNGENGKEFFEGMALPGNVIDVNGTTEAAHNAAYPVGLPAWFIRAFTDMGDIVFDPFLGSGTTLIAAERERRIAYGCELSPRFADVILRRAEAEGIGPIELIEAGDGTTHEAHPGAE